MGSKILQVPLMGRLGNQLFIYAAARAISLKQGREMWFSDYDYTLWHNDSRLDCFMLSDGVFYKDSLSFTPKQKVGNFLYKAFCRHKDVNQVAMMEARMQWLFHMFDMFMSQEGYLVPSDNRCDNLFVFGYFQSEKYFKEYKERILTELEFRTNMFCEDAQKLGRDISANPNSVCIHIRRGDYLKDPVFNVCKDDYYYRAIDRMSYIIPNAEYYVFSDSINEVKSLFSKYTKLNVSYIDSKYTDQESMYLGSCCSHFIMTNSSFSWWMQYLSKNPEKIVLAPSRWFGIERPCNIFQDNWQLIEV